MQALLSTAAKFLMRPVTAAELQDPAASIDAGAAVIAAQLRATMSDPPMVAAAYNAGGVYHDPTPENRWRMRCYPLGTGDYVDRFVAWFNDAMRLTVAVERAADAPSIFTALLAVDAA
jgi:soluble lytic murein transglycosylase-like protein